MKRNLSQDDIDANNDKISKNDATQNINFASPQFLVYQRNRQFIHPMVDLSNNYNSLPFTFCIAADTQYGVTSKSESWNDEIEISEKTVNFLNHLDPKPAFVCICGDLVDMEPSMFIDKFGTAEECIETQRLQYEDFKRTWKELDETIPLVCICGNHDVGNAPTPESIERYKSHFGDDYFAFWSKGCYFICLNTNLYNDNTNALERYTQQHSWLEERLQSAHESNARRIFLFGHHPWFLYDENELLSELKGENRILFREPPKYIPDSYFVISSQERKNVLTLCRQYQVDACFAGHFHQNHIAYTSWGMPMIVTAPLCKLLLESSGKNISMNKTIQNSDVDSDYSMEIKENTPKEHSEADHKSSVMYPDRVCEDEVGGVGEIGIRMVIVDDSLSKGFRHYFQNI